MDTTMIINNNRKFSNFASQFFLTEKRHNIGFVIPFALLTASEFSLRENSTKPLIQSNQRGLLQSS